MKSLSTFDLLLKALAELNEYLSQQATHVDLTIVGSMAIYLNGLEIDRMTEDIDYINYQPSKDFIKYAQIIAERYNLPSDWINSRAQDIEPLPAQLKRNLKVDNRFSHIKMKYIDTATAVQMKVYAYYIRGLAKDLADLKVLRPSKEQIKLGIEYTQTQIIHHHGLDQLEKDRDDLNQLFIFLTNELTNSN